MIITEKTTINDILALWKDKRTARETLLYCILDFDLEPEWGKVTAVFTEEEDAIQYARGFHAIYKDRHIGVGFIRPNFDPRRIPGYYDIGDDKYYDREAWFITGGNVSYDDKKDGNKSDKKRNGGQ